jgi:RNA-directed DNA polymerase
LKRLLRKRFKATGLLDLLDRVIDAHRSAPGRGLPIGALTSQHFANFYLNGLDRFLLEEERAEGFVRYMDDLVWWCGSREEAKRSRRSAERFASEALRLKVHPGGAIQRSDRGLSFLGFRIFPGQVRLSIRRRKRYARARRFWEREYLAGRIDARDLQAG